MTATLKGIPTSTLEGAFINGLTEEIEVEVRSLGPGTLRQSIVMAQRIAKRLEKLDQIRTQQARKYRARTPTSICEKK